MSRRKSSMFSLDISSEKTDLTILTCLWVGFVFFFFWGWEHALSEDLTTAPCLIWMGICETCPGSSVICKAVLKTLSECTSMSSLKQEWKKAILRNLSNPCKQSWSTQDGWGGSKYFYLESKPRVILRWKFSLRAGLYSEEIKICFRISWEIKFCDGSRRGGGSRDKVSDRLSSFGCWARREGDRLSKDQSLLTSNLLRLAAH